LEEDWYPQPLGLLPAEARPRDNRIRGSCAPTAMLNRYYVYAVERDFGPVFLESQVLG
jgi:hypothetical protein